MGSIPSKKINSDFFRRWSSDTSYVFGYFIADGCIAVSKGRRNPYTFNLTSVDKKHLYAVRKALGSEHKVSQKKNGGGGIGFQLQVRNQSLVEDLIGLGAPPTNKTKNLKSISVPDKYFSDFARGFFDGDGSVYIYTVNGTPQIKSSFISVSCEFIKNFNEKLCKALRIPEKSLHIKKSSPQHPMEQYCIDFYIDDSRKLFNLFYGGNPALYLRRKKLIFERWDAKVRRRFTKIHYPSKVGWHLNKTLKSGL